MLTKRVQVLMDPDEYDWVRRTAQDQGVSVGELARRALRHVHGPPRPDPLDEGLMWFVNGHMELPVPDDPRDLKREYDAELYDRFEKVERQRRGEE